MAKKSIIDKTATTQSLASAARTVTANGTAVDLQGYQGVVVTFNMGAWTDGTHTPVLQESADNSTFTAVGAADLDGSFTAVSGTASDAVSQTVGYTGNLRYVRASLTVAGASVGALSGATLIRTNKADAGASLVD